MASVFVTGFGSFSAIEDNPSAVLAQESGFPHRVLEVTWAAVDAWVESGEPDGYDALLLVGFASRDRLTPELYARNIYGDHPDVAGVHRHGEIEAGGPLLIDSTLWTQELLGCIGTADHWRFSLDAGSYLCNYISYRAIRRFPDKRVGFLHVPTFDRVPKEAGLDFIRRTAELLG